MDSYKVFETKSFQEDITQMDRGGVIKIKEKLQQYVYPQLKREPHFGPNIKKLKNWDPPTWRYRVGAWRFFYEIDDKEKLVYMIASDHRSRAYR